MCGIVGYIGDKEATSVLIEGLSRLEYRGYDSAGIAVYDNGEVKVRKYKGRLSVLADNLEAEILTGKVGIGHTRWATHGEPSDRNAHPHTNVAGNIAVIHNGIIENYMKIKEWLIEEKGIEFKSETDTEVIAHLIDHFYEGDLLQAVFKTIEKMEGAYALGVICKEEPDKVIAVRKDSPLIIGLGEGENFIASDIPALLKYTRNMHLIENDEIVLLTKDEVKIFNELGQQMDREVFHVTWDAQAAEKEGYEHFMIKEIHEQPKGVSETLLRRLDKEDHIVLDGIKLTKEDLDKINKIYIVACGTAYHAGLVGRYAIEKFAKIPVEVDVASEFRYRDPFVDENTLFIAISQSGETLDTLAALREAKRKGARILSIVNVVGSSVARESDDVFYTWAGPEIAVASTKAYTTQLVAMYLVALHMAMTKGTLSQEEYKKIMAELKSMPEKVQRVLNNCDTIQHLADHQFNNESVFYMGRGVDVNVAHEGSLKLKEISYINSFAIAAGELKHGTIALIEDGTLVVALATQDKLYDKMLSNIQEVRARGAYVVGVAKEGNKEIEKTADVVLYIPDTMDELTPILSVIPLQLLAYYIAVARGCDVDKPKNLAKSVTVE
ncbi:glutamine--fructose-6-phosphate transaminase (isomerizing) [Geosporobacter ferrireducens]|uniref:Glutamine--fructose-6-phosphate aminotransferase [isomerizing] n=1 Tax=Geosporobacter ferrireducens TaxID=1424294 RepID=A0A1D8GKF6_9FIRM|nr:glutamine--fructose-6-phosphate transaminase (isomerizing) [Geosporobacter ferrireducens]AOT71410.1 glutamine--fructose-6-phosphate aminotransferase [Geosporobacter ferrireducens]MTI57715.1 glutamine--fructose-6-phosphate transaminase (isomerizing) [Geosporobacter ferrireducens]